MSKDRASYAIRDLMQPGTAGEQESVERLRQRVNDVMNDVPRAGKAPTITARRSRRRTVALAIACALGVSGVAVAAGPAVVDKLFSDDQPVPAAISDFQAIGEPVSAAEYESVLELNRIPKGGPESSADPNDWVDVMSLATASDARGLGGDNVGRWIVVPSNDGSNACATYTFQGAPVAGLGGKCGMRFRASGVIDYLSMTRPNASSSLSYTLIGIVADGVESATVELSDGEAQRATLENNAVRWAGDEGESPCTLVVKRDGVSMRHEIEGPRERGCPAT